ncbi:protein farnesyltransferase/geranylgeranyltransferase type-1 subunit alpha [Triticum aestivum]|uniref:protein farnesyltransferase/geranylgeranyltransferase type-1 subunit alpha n=2 Tax=Triticinae TaxID=1648030 RepID=UPI001D00FD34|nr:protein farnesyltransferase/geranylgeranyltransferase type-1 subunit alpha-like [Triticum aestivum]
MRIAAARLGTSPETGYEAPFGPRYSAFESGGEAASFWGYGTVGAGVHRRRRPQRRRSEVGHGWSGARGYGERRGSALRGPWSPRSMGSSSLSSSGDRGRDGEANCNGELSDAVAGLARGRGRANGKGEEKRKLTTVAEKARGRRAASGVVGEAAVVWHFRRVVLEALDADLLLEMHFVDQIAESNPKNYHVWHHKRWLAEKIRPDAVNSEHDFTRKILAMDAKNYHAWSHRQWVIQALGGWESELQYCNQLLEEDVFNNSAWNQRYLVVTRSPILGGLAAMRDSEVDYTVEAIMVNPQNESPWRYLRGLYKDDNNLLVADNRISDACLKVLNKDWTCVFALSFLLDLLRMGLQPSDELKGTIEAMENSDPETGHADIAVAVCSILQKCDPLRINYWSWYQTTLSS